jgi:flagellar hook protein FlgE
MSFQQGLSGLSAAAVNLDVIGNNIANASTVGAKSSRAEFADLYAGAMGGQTNIGMGVTLAAVTQDLSPGNITPTGRNLDLAIDGSGFFQVQVPAAANAQDAVGALQYTRNGQFKSDKDGWIVTNSGSRLMGYGADATGAILKGQLQALKVPDARLIQKATTEVVQSFNLNSADPKKVPTFDPKDGKSYHYSSTVKIYDQLGQAVDVSTFYRKSDAGKWDVFATANGKRVPLAGTKIGSVDFTASVDGKAPPKTFQGTDTTAAATPVLKLSAADLETALNPTVEPGSVATTGVKYQFVVPGVPAGTNDVTLNLAGVTQQAGAYTVTQLSQNGYAVGELTGFSFDDEGVLTAKYSNGQSWATGQLAIASFRNPQGLQPLGGNAWQETQAVGTKVVDVPGTGNLGKIAPASVEESNVDLTAELVNLITAQRTYQANAQSIKTQDQVVQTFLNMR